MAKIVALFNNKGGVGKSTLSYHLGCALGKLGKRVLLVDADPQCNLTLNAMTEEQLERMWQDEDPFMEDFADAMEQDTEKRILTTPRSIHFLLKPIEDGWSDFKTLPSAKKLFDNMFILPGRLSMCEFESTLSRRWKGLFQGDALSIRTATAFRNICEKYAEKHNCDYVIVDTSSSLGIMNKAIISTIDGFFIPALPDMFSAYGIKNVGDSLEEWRNDFERAYRAMSSRQRAKFPEKFVQFIGYTICNAKRHASSENPNGLHFRYATLIPEIVKKHIKQENIPEKLREIIENPIGGTSVMFSHYEKSLVAQALKCPMWNVPEVLMEMQKANPAYLEENGITMKDETFSHYHETLEAYKAFALDFIERTKAL